MAAKRLPSIRVMAHTLQVPKPTIGDAYDRLVAHARSLLHADPASTYRRAPRRCRSWTSARAWIVRSIRYGSRDNRLKPVRTC